MNGLSSSIGSGMAGLASTASGVAGLGSTASGVAGLASVNIRYVVTDPTFGIAITNPFFLKKDSERLTLLSVSLVFSTKLETAGKALRFFPP